MKKIVILAGLALLAATSCSNETENIVINHDAEVIDSLVPVHVHVNDFSTTQEDFPETRTTSTPNSYSGVKAMILAFYSGDTEVYKTTQFKGSMGETETFGEFTLSLPIGKYTMVVLGYGYFDGDELTLTSPTQAAYSSDRPRETFSATQTVNITTTEAVEVSATLSRIVSKLQIVSTDGRTDDAANIRITFSAGGKAFNPTTGLATVNTGFNNTLSIGAKVGNTSNSAAYLFLETDEQTMNVTIETLDAQGNTIKSSAVNNVSFKRNRVTKLLGRLYTGGVSSSFRLATDWLDDTVINF